MNLETSFLCQISSRLDSAVYTSKAAGREIYFRICYINKNKLNRPIVFYQVEEV